jgi:hypothetical protein
MSRGGFAFPVDTIGFLADLRAHNDKVGFGRTFAPLYRWLRDHVGRG